MTRLVLFPALLLISLPAAALEHQVVFTSPTCPAYRYQQPVQQNDGQRRAERFGAAYCTKKDQATLSDESKIKRIISATMLDPGFRIREMDIAYYILGDDFIAELVCKKYAASPFTLRALISDVAPGRYAASSALDRMQACMGNDFTRHKIGCDVFARLDKEAHVSPPCADGRKNPELPIQVMHLKLLAMRGDKNGKAQAVIITGSGNPGRGMYANFEDWNFITVPENSAFVRRHRCMVDTIIVSERDALPPVRLAGVYKTCIAAQVSEEDNITTLFLPAETAEYRRQLLDAIGRANSISIAALQFKSESLRDALLAARKRGASVRLLMDDNTYYAALAGKDFDTALIEDYRNHIAPLKAQGIELRFLETNHEQSGLRNLVHHRFVIAERGQERQVFTGSAHLIDDALQFNFESQYVFHDTAADAYRQEFEALWARSLPWGKMPATPVAAEEIPAQ